MRRRAVILPALFIAATLLVAAWLIFFRSGLHVSGPFPHEAYVWQRAWTEPVRNAVAQHATNFSALTVLKAEVSWKDKKPQVVRVALDYPTLIKAERPIGIALRIGPFAGPFGSSTGGTHPQPLQGGEQNSRRSNAVPLLGGVRGGSADGDMNHTNGEAITLWLTDLAASLVAEARANHLNLSELQIDFDCAESKLDGYRVWVEAIQHRVAPLPVTITALPSWLKTRAFARLAGVATNYVLQVHSVERPRSFDAPFTLCDPVTANRAVERAGRIGVPFCVALPTYGYTLAFDQIGKFVGLSAEGARPNWPTNAQLREIHSDPIQLAGLVQKWTARRPAAMRGVIWYRLPVVVDNFNWRWPTLGAILEARVPREVLRVSMRRVESGLVEINLANEGELDFSSRLAVEVRWSNARLVAGDALRDFELADRSASAARIQTRSQPCHIRAGESLVLGWLRFDRDCEVQCELRKL